MDCNCVPAECIDEKKGSSFGSLLKGILFGGLVGASMALLSTPRSGIENRNMIRDKSMELRNQAEQVVQDTRQKAEQVVQDTRQKVEGIAQKGMDQASGAKGQGQSFIGQQKTKVESIVVGVREGVKTYTDLNSSGQDNPMIETYSSEQTMSTPNVQDFNPIVPDQPGDIQPYDQNPLNPLG